MIQVKENPTRSIPPIWLEIFKFTIFGLAYWASIRAGLLLVVQPEGISTIWPASGLALAALLLSPKKRWAPLLAIIFTITLTGNWINGNELPVSLWFALGGVLEAVLCAWTLISLRTAAITFADTRDVFALLGVVLIVNSITALLGATVVTLAYGSSFISAWQIWWISNGLGILLITPVIVTWARNPHLHWSKPSGKILEGILLIVLLTIFAFIAFGSTTTAEHPILDEYMLLPLLIWLAFRFNNPRNVSSAILLVAGIAIWGTLQRYGLFAHRSQSVSEEMAFLQIYILVMTFSGLLLNAVIAERNRNNETLKIAEANYRNILEHAPIGFFQSYPNGGYRNVNPRMAQIFGYESPTEMQQTITDIPHQIYVEPAMRQEFTRQLLETGHAVNFVTQHRRKNGSSFWAATNARIVHDEHGQPFYYEGFIQDIDEAVKAEQNIQESRKFVQATMDSLSAHICVLEADGIILAVNRAWMDFASQNPPVTANGIVGINYLKVCDAATGAEAQMAHAFAAGIRAVIAGTQESFSLEYPCHAPHEQRWFIGRVMRFADPTSQRVVIAHENITERKLAEDALRVSEEKWRTLFAILPVGITILDAKRRVTDFNPALAEILEISADGLRDGAYTRRKYLYADGSPMPAEEFPSTRAMQEQTVIQSAQVGVIKEDGNILWTEISAAPLALPNAACVVVTTDVTRRKQVELALRESERNIRTFFETMTEGMALNEMIFNENGEMVDYRILDVNPAFYQSGNFNNVQVIGNLATQLYNMPYETIHAFWLAHRDRNTTAYTEIRSPLSDKWFYVATSPFVDGKFVTSFLDITLQKNKQEELAEINQRLSLAQSAAGAGLWDWDMRQNFYNWSPELFELFGLDPTITPTAETWRNSIHPEDCQLAENHIEIALREHLPINNEYRIVRPSGDVRWVNALGNTTYDEQGQPLRMAGICIDITARKQAEHARLESEARLKGIVSSAMDGIVMVDSQQRITLFNPAAERMFGYTAGKVIGQPLDMILPRGTQQIHHQHIERFGETGISTRNITELIDITAERATGETFPLEQSISQFMVNGQKFYTAILRDVTERKLMEHNLRTSLQEKEVLLKEVHHRVKNNLQIVSSLLSMQASSAKDEKVTHALEESKNRVRAMALIHEKLYRSESLEYIQAEEYIPELINNLANSMAGFKKERVKFDMQITTATLDIGKAIPCGMIVTELISNALKYAFPREEQGVVQVHLEKEMDTGRIRLLISDNGVGLPPELDLAHPETLGLELVSILSRQLKAELQIIRQPGTTYILSFRN